MPFNTPNDRPGRGRSDTLPWDKRAYWTQAQTGPLEFGVPDTLYGPVTGVTSRAVWQTPLFDLRTYLGLTDGYAQRRQKDIGEDVLLGIDFNLFVKIDMTLGAPLGAAGPYLKFYFMEFSDPVNPEKRAFINLRQDITTAVYSGYYDTATQDPVVSLLYWVPTGPVRYWGVTLIVDNLAVAPIVLNPTIQMTAALH